MTTGLAIGEAGAADDEAVIGLWEACGLTRPWNDPLSDFNLALSTDGSTVLAARVGGEVVGTIMVGFDGHRGWVYYLAVDPDAQRSGLGRALMAAAEAWLVARGCPKIQLMVRQDNAQALAFYEALGLTPQPVVVLGRRLDGA